MGKRLQRFLALFDFLSISLLFLYGFFYGVILNSRFLLYQYTSRLNVTAKLKLDRQQLENITHGIVRLMKGTGEETYFPIIVKGQEVSFLNAKELTHLEEIAGILSGVNLMMLVLLVLAVLVTVVLVRRGTACNIAIGTLEGFGVLGILGAGIGLAAVLDLDRWIDSFHEIFFTGYNWVLNPATDRLIHLCPPELFQSALIWLGVFEGTYCAVVLGICLITLLSKHTGSR
ncbi:MAG: DUF1461 domain-containing protein [Acetatifactor sp.]